MRILYVSAEGRLSGAEHSLLLLLRHTRHWVEPVVACPASSDLLTRCGEKNIACEELPPASGTGALSKRWCLIAACHLRHIIRRVRPDIVHANNFHAMAVASLSRGIGASRFLWHARDYPRSGLLGRWCETTAHGIIAVSQSIRWRLAELGVRDEKIDVVYNGTDLAANEPLDSSTSGLQFTFACVGQIVRWKNQGGFLEAARIVHEQLPSARFLLVGSNVFQRSDPYEAELKNTIAVHGMSYVEQIDWQQDMESIWRRTDCLVHTALNEPFGRVLIEAMAHGRPVIAYDSGGPAEIVKHDRTGLLVPFGNTVDLSDAMMRLARDRDLAASMGRTGRKRVRDEFGAARAAEGVMSVYRQILKGK